MLKLLDRLSLAPHGLVVYLTALILIVVPLFPKFPFIDVLGAGVSVRIEDFIMAISILVVLFWYLPRAKGFLQDKINQSIFIFLAVGFVSLLAGAYLTETVDIKIAALHWLRRVEYLSAFFIGFASVHNKKNIVFYVKILFLVSLFAFVFGAGQKYFSWPIITTQNFEYARGLVLFYTPQAHLVSTFAGHYDLATYIVFTIPLLWLLVFDRGQAIGDLGIFKNQRISRAFVGIIAILSLWLLVNAASRISIVSYLGSVSLALLLLRRYWQMLLVVLFSFYFILTASNLMDRYMRIFDVVIENISSTAVLQVYAQGEIEEEVAVAEDRSSSIRLNVEWPRALRAFYKNPFFGTGYSSITLATDNGYLRILGEIGALGFAAFFLLISRLAFCFSKAYLKMKKIGLEELFVISILSSFPGVLLNMVFIDVFEASKFAIIFWLLTGMAVRIVKNKNYA